MKTTPVDIKPFRELENPAFAIDTPRDHISLGSLVLCVAKKQSGKTFFLDHNTARAIMRVTMGQSHDSNIPFKTDSRRFQTASSLHASISAWILLSSIVFASAVTDVTETYETRNSIGAIEDELKDLYIKRNNLMENGFIVDASSSSSSDAEEKPPVNESRTYWQKV